MTLSEFVGTLVDPLVVKLQMDDDSAICVCGTEDHAIEVYGAYTINKWQPTSITAGCKLVIWLTAPTGGIL